MANPELMETVYHEVTITYDERDNRWHFEVEGRERSSESLSKAKEMIDNPPKEKSKFKRFQAYYKDCSYKFELVTVTSIAEGSSWDRSLKYRIVTSRGQHFKIGFRDLVAINPENERKIVQMAQNSEVRSNLQDEFYALENSLARVPDPNVY